MKFYFTLFIAVFLLIYISTFHIIQVPYSRSYYFNSFQNMCGTFENKMMVARLTTEGPFSTSYIDYFPENCSLFSPPMVYINQYWTLKTRPIVGDHIHLLYKIIIDNKPVIFHDRNLSESIAYETPPEACPSTVPYAYKKAWYHTGVHSHCDRSPSNSGIIHVHPWSAPKQLRVEGRDVNLGMFFESVGIERSTLGKGFLVNGKYRKLHMTYYTNVDNNKYSFSTQNELEIMMLWLSDCHGAVVIWDDHSTMPEITEKDREYVKSFRCHPINYPIR